ncbi:transposable element Tcb2 transposase [Trichonephila clavipes]|nr:transposable element Tcb2 transposase [Trichonephila clavipes]
MDWPAYSPDLNPIKHVWDALGRRIATRLHHPENTQQLKQMLIEEWALLTQKMLHQLLLIMRRRCEATIAVCFSDESTFEILQNKAQFVRRRRGEKFHSDCVFQTVKHSTKIMIWSVISGKGTGRLDVVIRMMRQDQYKDILQNRLIPQLEEWFPNGESYIFMQAGASCHAARSIKVFLVEQSILLLDWLGNSPDMNTIENVWELMKIEVAKDVITNKTQLLEIHVWNHLPQMQETVQSYIDSMPRRIEALIAAKGGTTKY